MKKLLLILAISLGYQASQAQAFNIAAMLQPAGAVMTTSGSLSLFTAIAGTPSASQNTAAISGTALIGNITATSPGAWLELSLNGTVWASSIVFVRTGGVLAGQPVFYFVRTTASASAGSYSGNITFTTTGAVSVFMGASATISGATGPFWRLLTLNHNLVPADQTNFPVLFSGTFSYLKTVANGGFVQNASAFDVTFSTDQAGTSLLNWDVEYYNPVTGQIVAWVRIPALSSLTDNLIYLRYGDASIVSYLGNAPLTWNAGYTQVIHMKETLSGAGAQTLTDATSNANNMTSHGSWIAGQQAMGAIGPSLSLLNASGDYFTFPDLANTTAFTVEYWANISVADATSLGWGNSFPTNENTNWFGGQHRMFTGSGDQIADNTATTINTWTYLAFTRNGTAGAAYHNGTSTATNSSGAARTFNQLGRYGIAPTISANIKFDEVRISNVARSSTYMTTCYNTATNSSFIAIGPQN